MYMQRNALLNIEKNQYVQRFLSKNMIHFSLLNSSVINQSIILGLFVALLSVIECRRPTLRRLSGSILVPCNSFSGPCCLMFCFLIFLWSRLVALPHRVSPYTALVCNALPFQACFPFILSPLLGHCHFQWYHLFWASLGWHHVLSLQVASFNRCTIWSCSSPPALAHLISHRLEFFLSFDFSRSLSCRISAHSLLIHNQTLCPISIRPETPHLVIHVLSLLGFT